MSKQHVHIPSSIKTTMEGYSIRLAESEQDVRQAMAIRYDVFSVEQGYDTKIDIDGLDGVSDHLLLIEDKTGEAIGTIRWITTSCKLGRVAVRKEYRGKLLVLGLEEHLKQRRGLAGKANLGKSECTINVSSQQPVVSFYTRLGYEVVGDPYIEAGTPHVYCKKAIPLSS